MMESFKCFRPCQIETIQRSTKPTLWGEMSLGVLTVDMIFTAVTVAWIQVLKVDVGKNSQFCQNLH